MALYHRILLAVDLSADSLRIAQRARTLASVLDAELQIIHVVEPIPIVPPMPPDPVVPVSVTTQTELVAIAEEHISSLTQELGVPDSRRSVVVGNIKNEIVRAAADQGTDLIVIGSRERHGLAFLIKPTEDVVVHRAPCDVLAVRLPDDDPKPRKKSG
jgi:universal stress protein A